MTAPHSARRTGSWERLRELHPQADGFLITEPANVRYLSGFSGSNGMLLMGSDGAVLGTDGRYLLQAAQECPDLPLVVDRSTLGALADRWVTQGGGVLAIDADHLTLAQARVLADRLGSAGSLCETSGIVEAQRIVKDAHELDLIRAACRISDEALRATIETVRVGDTERAIARRLESMMFECGADALSFETIVAGGPHSAIPHHQPTDRPLERGDFLLIDFGAAVGGYHADETRTFVLGAPAEWQLEIHALVSAAAEAGRAAAVAGATLRDVDSAARDLIGAAGHAEHFDHGLGHGVGLQIHEAPFFSARAEGMLLGDSPVTVEPGVYLAERGGVRIEDTVIVTEGPSIPLTATERGLVVLG